MAHLLPHTHSSTTAVVLASPACWCCNNVSKGKGQKLYGNSALFVYSSRCSCALCCCHFIRVESSRVDGCPPKQTVFRCSDDRHLKYFISCPFLFCVHLSLSLLCFFLGTFRSTKQRKTIGACYLHFYVDPISLMFFSPLLRATTNLAPAQQFSS